MPNKILMKRGVKSSLPNGETGEIHITTDTNEIYLGDGGTGIFPLKIDETNVINLSTSYIQTSHDTNSVTSAKITNWDTAHGWGDHSLGGYQQASTAITTSNIASQTVSHASTATTASSITGQGALATLSAVNTATITDNSVGATELNVVGNGTTAQYLRSDGDGTFTWATPTDTNTTYTAGTGLSLVGTTITNTAPNVTTNLGYTASTTNGTVTSSDGTNATIPLVVAAGNAGLMTGTDKTKLNGIENSYLKTTDRLLIDEDGKALLPSEAIGDIVWNMAMIFDSPESSVIEKEVTVTTDGIYAYFDISDNIFFKYCIMSYLTYKVVLNTV